MDYLTFGLGVAMCGFGAFTSVVYFVKPSLLGKLEPMKERWGPGAGMALHVTGYVILPITAGIVFILRGLQGQSIF